LQNLFAELLSCEKIVTADNNKPRILDGADVKGATAVLLRIGEVYRQ
jgi:hypothetical protein